MQRSAARSMLGRMPDFAGMMDLVYFASVAAGSTLSTFVCRGGPIRIGWKRTAAASVVQSDSASSLPMLDVPGWLENHKLPNATAVVMALKMTARVKGEASKLVSPARQAST